MTKMIGKPTLARLTAGIILILLAIAFGYPLLYLLNKVLSWIR